MSVLPEMPRQRAGREATLQVRSASKEALQPLHDDILEQAGPSFRGLTAFAIDHWYTRSASNAVTLLPPTDNPEAYRFYDDNIEIQRIDLAATAFGRVMDEKPRAQYLPSQMNPDHHLTYTQRVENGNRAIGGVQAVFDSADGQPLAEHTLESIYKAHTPAIETVLHEFDALALSGTVRSLGDTFEMLAPTTPNAYTISWDLAGSTEHARAHYGALRNYLLDAKEAFNRIVSTQGDQYHDNGDGQDMFVWLPPAVNRADSRSVSEFGRQTVLPLLHLLQAAQQELAVTDYSGLEFEIRLTVGLAHVEQNRFEKLTTSALWDIDGVMNTEARQGIAYTEAARAALRSLKK